jgi:aspartate/methionine/tyrosine aminotransferase
MNYLDQEKIKQFEEAMKNKEAARANTREKSLPTPAEIREQARKQREDAQKKKSPWQGMD